MAAREGWSYHHVQAIIMAIDQDAEAALGNREYFLNRPHGIGWTGKNRVPLRAGSRPALQSLFDYDQSCRDHCEFSGGQKVFRQLQPIPGKSDQLHAHT
jgi:hypothetical protein